jgi:micrococcal nuclease
MNYFLPKQSNGNQNVSKKIRLILGIGAGILIIAIIVGISASISSSNDFNYSNQTATIQKAVVDRMVTIMMATSIAKRIVTEEPTLLIPSITPNVFTSTPLILAPGADCIPNNPIEVAVVSAIVDGDTVHVRMNGQEYKVRYIGMDAPETGTGVAASNATAANQAMTTGQTVLMVKDVSDTDKYGRLLRYVIAGNGFVNYELVRQGYAKAKDYPPDTACSANLATAMNKAKGNQLGLWQSTASPVPVVLATSAPVRSGEIQTSGSNCDPAYPTVCIPPPPPDLDCGDVQYRRFQVLAPDPHNFDRDGDGIGCES